MSDESYPVILNRLREPSVTRLFAYELPLSDGTLAHVDLPENLTVQDAERLCRMIGTLVQAAAVPTEEPE